MRYYSCFETNYPMTEEAMYDALAVTCGEDCKVEFVTPAEPDVNPKLAAMALDALRRAAIEMGIEEGVINETYSVHEKVND